MDRQDRNHQRVVMYGGCPQCESVGHRPRDLMWFPDLTLRRDGMRQRRDDPPPQPGHGDAALVVRIR